MITKTAAIGLGTTALFAMPHAMDAMDGNKSLPGAVLSTAGDIGAWKASDYVFDKVFKPKNYNIFQDAPNAKWYQPWKKLHLTKNFQWAKAMRNGIGRMAFAAPFFAASSMLTDGINNTLFPGKNQKLMQQYYNQYNQYNNMNSPMGAAPMIQKHASLSPYVLTEPAIGALRASALSDKEKDIITQAYDLPEDANLRLRNAGRGIAGGVIGGAVSTIPAAALARGFKRSYLFPAFMHAGSFLGALKGTDKYSKSGVAKAQQILDERRRRSGKN